MMQARVKSVLSGDTVVLQHLTRDVQKQLTFAGVNAPRLARKDQNSKDEPCAFEAREFLRRKCVGKVVSFRVDYTNPATKRDFGVVFVESENVVVSLVAAGLAKVKESEKNQNRNSDYVDELVEAENYAKSAGVGIWQPKEKLVASVRAIKFDPPAKATFESFKKKPYKAIVEHVINGSSLRILVLPGYEYITINMTGIQCPSAREGKEEEYALEAKQFTETYLLQRDIQVLFEGVDKFDNFLATVLLPNSKTFQEELLLQGFAVVQDWTVSKTKYAAQLRTAESTAKSRCIRRWKNYEAPKSSVASAIASGSAAGLKRDFTGKVIEVLSGDTIIVKDDKNVERKISLSSIRTPKLAGRDKPAESYAVEARELVRQRLIGKKVQVHIDYKSELKMKSKNESGKETEVVEDRFAASVLYENGKKNIAVDLLNAGYANIIFHKAGQEKSVHYDKLKQTYDEAVAASRGIHGNKNNAPVHRVVDISFETQSKVNKHFTLLQHKGKLKAVVERVYSASRFKLYIPREYLALNFALANIITPALARKNVSASTGASSSAESSAAAGQSDKPAPLATDEPFAKQALDFVREHVLNREVSVEFERVDKSGALVGTLSIGTANFAVTLLEQGLAKLAPGAERSKNYPELKQGQDTAEQQKRRIWASDAASKIGARRAPRRQRKVRTEDTSRLIPAAEGEYLKMRVTEVVTPTRFFAQTNDAADALAALEAKIANLNLDEATPAAGYKPRRDELCFAKFSADNRWYRAKVVDLNEKDKTVIVDFVDFGNHDEVSFSDVRPYSDSVPKSEPLAQQFQLAFVYEDDNEEADEDILADGLDLLKGFCWDKDLVAKVEYRDGTGNTFVTLMDVKGRNNASINAALVSNGLVFVDHSVKDENAAAFGRAVDALAAQEAKAKSDHLALWQFGVPLGGEDDEY